MSINPCFWAIVPAAGTGSRMRSNTPKQYLLISGEPVISLTLQVLLDNEHIKGVVVALNQNDSRWTQIKQRIDTRIHRVIGGPTRAKSVLSALIFLQNHVAKDDWVLVHDAARPCLRAKDLKRLIHRVQAPDCAGALLAVPADDTMKRANAQGQVIETVSREALWHAQTPQCFRYQELKDALDNAIEKNLPITDEASAMEYSGIKPILLEGQADNIKITRPFDLKLAEIHLAIQAKEHLGQ